MTPVGIRNLEVAIYTTRMALQHNGNGVAKQKTTTSKGNSIERPYKIEDGVASTTEASGRIQISHKATPHARRSMSRSRWTSQLQRISLAT